VRVAQNMESKALEIPASAYPFIHLIRPEELFLASKNNIGVFCNLNG